MIETILRQIPHWRDMDASDWLFAAAILAANVVPCGLFIWGLSL